jgi:hypothetical protein
MTRHASFWDRRRAGVRAEQDAALRAVEAQIEAEDQAILAEKTDAELLVEFDLPDPDTMKAGDDFTAFMARAIPDHLRRRALRKLWVSNPVLACLDDLVDYADDYTQASAVTSFSTTYEVGKGLRRHIEDVARKALATSEEQEDLPVVATDKTPAIAEEEPPNQEVGDTVNEAQEDIPEDIVMQPRRMTFRFEEQSA